MDKNRYKNIKILYVEDENLIRQNALEYLSRYFEFVYEAKDGIEALEKIEKFKPHIIITDIKMPKLNGLDLAKKIRQKDKKTQIIIATAHTNTEYLIQAVELQLVKYLVKPILEFKLILVLKQCIRNIENDLSNIIRISSNVVFDTFNKILLEDENIVKLTKNEILFLELLCSNTQKVVSYEQIENFIWYDSYMSTNAIRSLVKALRKKMPKDSIENLSGIGYKINLCS